MTATSVLGGGKAKGTGPRKKDSRPHTIDRVLGFIRWTGFVFLLLGVTDVGLTWFPADFGNREWEFATVTASFNGMPLVLLGLLLMVVAATVEVKRIWGLLVGMVGMALFGLVIAAVAIWATNLPLVLGAVEGVVLTSIKKAIFKTAVQGIVLPLILGAVAYQGFKTFRGSKT